MGVPKSGNLGGKVTFKGVEIPDVLSWSMPKSADNQAFVSSQTEGETDRTKGNIDRTATVEMLLNNLLDLPFEVGDDGPIELFTGNDPGVGGKWTGEAIVDGIEPSVNPSTGENVGASITFGQKKKWTFSAN